MARLPHALYFKEHKELQSSIKAGIMLSFTTIILNVPCNEYQMRLNLTPYFGLPKHFLLTAAV